MPKYKDPQIELLRATLTEILEDYIRKAKITIAKNKALGMSLDGIRAIRESDRTKWAARKEVLNRDIKREVGGVINRIYRAAGRGELKG